MAIKMRTGNEADFDPSKMIPGEWAVSLDTRYVRMCFAPGIVLRMATYEAFEADMKKMQAILEECMDIRDAISRIQAEFNEKTELVIEYANGASESAEKAEKSERIASEKAQLAAVSEENAKKSETNAQQSSTDASKSLEETQRYAEEVADSIEQVKSDKEYVRTTASEVNAISSVVKNNADQAKNSASEAKISEENAKISENNAKMYAENASGVTDVQIATKDRAGLIKGGDNHIAEDGTLTLTKRVTGATLHDSYEGGVLVHEIGGVSEQNTTTGAQLLNLPNVETIDINGVAWTCKDGVVTAKGTSTAMSISTSGGIYYDIPIVAGNYYVSGNTANARVYVSVQSSDGSVKYYTNKSFILDGTEVVVKGYIQISSGITIDDVLYPMLNQGTEPLPWEPYTGGIASPNPDYPQEIKNVVLSEIKSTDDNGKESAITLSTPITLNGIGDVKDKIVRKDGVWGIERSIKEATLNGSETWYITTTASSDKIRFATRFSDIVKTENTEVGNLLCSHYRAVTELDTYNNINGVSYGRNKNLSFYDEAAVGLDEDRWKAILAENPITVLYELAESVFKPLPSADQTALNGLVSFNGVTYLSCDSEIEPTFDVEYGTSKVGGYILDAWNKAENNRINNELLRNVIISLGGNV